MTTKLAVLVSTLITLVSGAAVAFITYFEPANATVLNSAIDIASGAAITIVNLFAVNEVKKLVKAK